VQFSGADEIRIKESAHNMLRSRAKSMPRIPHRDDDDLIRTAAKQLPGVRDRAIIEFLYSSGCRRSELCNLDVGDLDLDMQMAQVTGKGARERKVHMSTLAADMIRAYLASRGVPRKSEPVFCRHTKKGKPGPVPKRLSTQGVYNLVRDTCHLAGVDPKTFTPHSFRHAFAIRVLKETKDLAMTQDLLGHADPVSTRVYATIYPEDLRAAHKKIFG
jgi:integrase/recombinase XerD